MNKQQIIEILKTEKLYLKEHFGVEEIALFGSYARGEEQEDSDIDFLVKFERPSYSWLVGLSIYLENKFKAKVDVIRRGPHLTERFLNLINDDLIYA